MSNDTPLTGDELVPMEDGEMGRRFIEIPTDGWALRAARRILNNTTLVKGSEARMASIILHEYDKHRRSLPKESTNDTSR